MLAPGDCSPSLSVVSKIIRRSATGGSLLGMVVSEKSGDPRPAEIAGRLLPIAEGGVPSIRPRAADHKGYQEARRPAPTKKPRNQRSQGRCQRASEACRLPRT